MIQATANVGYNDEAFLYKLLKMLPYIPILCFVKFQQDRQNLNQTAA